MTSTCTKCGAAIRFIRMVNSGKWSCGDMGADRKCSHTPQRD